MADVQGLYIVTAVVLVGLFSWVAVVLARAPRALDESKRRALAPVPAAKAEEPGPVDGAAPPVERPATPEEPRPLPEPVTAKPELPAEPAPQAPPSGAPVRDTRRDATTVPDVSKKAAAAAAAVAAAAEARPPADAPPAAAPLAAEPVPPVVVLPPIRQRLDSHPEIQDSPTNAPVIVMPDGGGSAKQAPSLTLATAVGRSDPEPGKAPEHHAIVEQDHLFLFADGAGRKAGPDLVSGMAVEALTQAFARDEASAIVDDPKLSARANRVRRAVLAANTALLKRARALAFAGLGASAFVGHFSPKNDELFVARVGANRAYRLRAGELVRLTSSVAARQVGLIARVEVEVVTSATLPGDTYLFCSEGAAQALGDEGLKAALQLDPSLGEVTKRLVATLNAKGGAEDQLAIVVRVEANAPSPGTKPARARTVLGLG